MLNRFIFSLCMLMWVSACALSGMDETVEDSNGQQGVSVSLQVGTYNVFLRQAFLEGIAYDRSNPSCRAQKIGEQLGERHFDILALEESFDDALSGTLLDSYKRARTSETWSILGAPWPKPVGPGPGFYGCFDEEGLFINKLNGFRLANGGLSLISSHPFIGETWTDVGPLSGTIQANFGPTARGYCECGGEDCLAFKGLSYAPIRLQKEGQTIDLNVISTHLNASGDPEIRQKQLRSLVAFVEQRLCTHPSRNSWPLILLGDLNVGHTADGGGNEDYLAMMGELSKISCMNPPQDAYLEVHQSWDSLDANAGTSTCAGSTLKTCAFPEPTRVSRRVDYIMVFAPKINVAFPSAASWQVQSVTSAYTEALIDPACAFEYRGETYNSAGHLSDHKLLTATIELRRAARPR